MRQILYQPSFLPYILTRGFTAFAIQIQSLVVSWYLYDTTKDPMALAYVGLAQFVPMVLCLPISGDVADRFRRKFVLGFGLFVACLCSFALLLCMQFGQVYLSYLILVVFGAARSFINPTLQSLLPQLVPKEKLPQSLATNSTLVKISVILGPVVGGFLYVLGGAFAYLACTLAFLCAILPLIWVKPLYAHTPLADKFALNTVIKRFYEGGRFIWSNPVVLGVISLDLFAVLLGGVVALLPIYASEVLHVGADGLGILKSAMAIGGIGTGAYLAHYPITTNVGKVMLVSVALFGVANLVFAFSTLFWLSFVALVFAGVFDMISVNIRGSLIQLSTPDSLRGRVSAVNMLFITSSNELGAFRAGYMANALGVVPTAIAGGGLTLAVVAFMAYRFKELRQVKQFDDCGIN